jgi:SPP1 gp7 family putative phage head morphogenesis protein
MRSTMPQGMPSLLFPIQTFGMTKPIPQEFSSKRPSADLIEVPPLIEIFNRGYFGSSLDMESIEHAMYSVRRGVMHFAMDLIRESLWNAPAVRTMVYRRISQVASMPWDITPAETDNDADKARAEEYASMVRRVFKRASGTRGPENACSFRDLIFYLMAATLDGRAAAQVNYESVTGVKNMRWAATGFSWIHPSRLAYGPMRELRIIERYVQTGMYTAIGPALNTLPHRFVVHHARLGADYPEYDGLWLSMLYYLFFHRTSWRERMKFIERWISGWRKVTGPGGIETHVTKEAVQEGAERASELGGETNTWWGAPGVDLTIVWPAGNAHEMLRATPEDVENALAKLILGQANTTDGNSYGKGLDGLKDEQLLIAMNDAETLAQTINRLFEQFIALNVSPNAIHLAPQFSFRIKKDDDPNEAQARFSVALQDGLKVPEKQYRKECRIDEVAEGEAYLIADPMQPGSGRARLVDPANPELHPEKLPTPPAEPTPSIAAEATAHDIEEELVARCRLSFTRKMGEWADTFVKACTGKDDWKDVNASLKAARDAIDHSEASWPIEELIVRGQMIGIVEAAADADEDETATLEANHVHASDGYDEDDVLMLSGGRTLLGLIGDFVRKPFVEAVRTFAAKKVVPRSMFDKLRGEAKREAFTIAGLATRRQLEVAKDEVKKAIEDGDSPRTFFKRLSARFTSAGMNALSTSHSETVLRNATMGAFADGRYKQMTQPEVLKARPYWQVRGVGDRQTRETHRANHGKVVRGDDPKLQTKRLPWGHRCRCRFVSLSPAQVEQRGLAVVDADLLHGVPDSGWNS